MTQSRWIKCITAHGNIRGVAIQATDLAKSMAERHGLKGIGARGLGEAAIGSLLIASYCKPGERVNLNIQGSGFFKQALVDAYPEGIVRGYVIEQAGFGSASGEENQMGPWGHGLLSVLRTKGTEGKQPYIGTVPLVTGHLAKDLTFYWAQSEQVPSSVGIAVNLEGDEISSAGGFLVQAMPGATDEELKLIERRIHDIQSLTNEIAGSENPTHILSQIFQDSPFHLVEERELKFECHCSWERVESALLLVGAKELHSMLTDQNHATVRCDFCAKEYQVDADHLKKLIDRAR